MEKGSKRGAVDTCNAYVGGPGAAEPISNRGFSLKKKERLTTTMQQGATEYPPGSTLLDLMPPGMLKKELIETRTADGTREMEGSNTPWAQGPANLFWCVLPLF